jgi:NADPH:quinone reductase-like Zn-dependent oxidoreductase
VWAIVQGAYGAPDDVLALRDVPLPSIRDDEVLVHVRAASMHPDIWHTVYGVPYALRIMGGGLRGPKNPILGTDVAGVVEAVGDAATRFRVGDAVFGEIVSGNQWTNGGAYAEYAAARESRLAPKPATVTFEQAASVPTSALIALRAVRREGRVRSGQSVLVNGAGGGVGTMAVQIARASGAHVTAVDSSEKAEMLRTIGAEHVIDYAQEDFTRGGDRYDLILDLAGNHRWREVRRAVTPHGTYVLIGDQHVYGGSNHRWIGSLGRFLGLMVRSTFDRRLPGVRAFRTTDDDPMATVADLVEAGSIVPVVDRTYDLSQVVEAIHHMEAGTARGRIVITI